MQTWTKRGMEALYWGLSLGIANCSMAFLFARIWPTGISMALMVFVQIALFVGGLIVTRSYPHIFEAFGPIGVAVCFMSGIVVTMVVIALQSSVPVGDWVAFSAIILVLESIAAMFFGVGNVFNIYFLFHYCSISTEQGMCFNAIVGSLVACVLSIIVVKTFDHIVLILCLALAVAWVYCHRQVSTQTKEISPSESNFDPTQRSLLYLYAALIVLSFASGFFPFILYTGVGESVLGVRERFVMALALLAAIVIPMASGRHLPVKIIEVVRIWTLIVATGFLLLVIRNSVLASLGTAIIGYGLFVLAAAEIMCCANYVGNPAEHPVRFWVLLIVVQVSTALIAFLTIGLERIGIGFLDASPSLPLVCIYLLLVFLFFFQKIWVEPTVATSHDLEEVLPSFTGLDDAQKTALEEGYSLTRREVEVLAMLGRGWTVEIIAKQLVISPHTVRTHVKRLYQKINAHSRSDVIMFLDDLRNS